MKLCGEDHPHLERARQQIFDAYGADPNVSGVGIGFRRRAGEQTDQPAVVVLVARKRPEALVSRLRLLPRTVEVDGTTYQVDVLQAGPFSSKAQTLAQEPTIGADPITGKMRPPRQGASISNLADGKAAGTLGLFVIDNTDDTVCLLTCNHVIGRMGHGAVGDPILQPGGYDGGVAGDKIATLKRWSPVDPAGFRVDGAIAQLTDQSAYTLEVAKDLMAPISAGHPVVGMSVAGDAFGGCLLTRMDATLDALNVRLPLGQAAMAAPKSALPCNGPVMGLADPQPGMNIEKVGRTSAYTSSRIVAIGVQATVTTAYGPFLYKDLIYTEYFHSSGDSGSVVFAGGNGEMLVAASILAPCIVLESVGDFYKLPLPADNPLVDKARDEFLLQSATGRLLVELTYVNSSTIIERVQDREAASVHVGIAQELYNRYRDRATAVLADPDSPEVVTEEDLSTASLCIHGLAKDNVLTFDEVQLANKLYAELLNPTLGMTRREVQAYMDNPAILSQVHGAVATAPEVELNAPFKHTPPEPSA